MFQRSSVILNIQKCIIWSKLCTLYIGMHIFNYISQVTIISHRLLFFLLRNHVFYNITTNKQLMFNKIQEMFYFYCSRVVSPWKSAYTFWIIISFVWNNKCLFCKIYFVQTIRLHSSTCISNYLYLYICSRLYAYLNRTRTVRTVWVYSYGPTIRVWSDSMSILIRSSTSWTIWVFFNTNIIS